MVGLNVDVKQEFFFVFERVINTRLYSQGPNFDIKFALMFIY
jgi:hypothetical protein